MRKLLLFLSIAAVSRLQAQSQVHTQVVSDTVHYFFNKHYFKTGTPMESFPYYKLPYATQTLVAHAGTKFRNTEPIGISGLEALMTRDYGSTKLSIPVRLYLCTLQNNLPVLPGLDSVLVNISGDTTFTGPVGGSFAGNQTHLLTSDFAILVRNVSTSSGDSVRLARTAGRTMTNSAAPAPLKYGESAGYLNWAGNFFSTTNFSERGFGVGTDHEFCVAPRVQYTLTSSHLTDEDVTRPVCTWEAMTFTSTSSSRFMNEQYNLVEFARKWGYNPPFHQSTLKIMTTSGLADVFPADSSISWYFAPEDNGCNCPHPRVFLPGGATGNTISFSTDSAWTSRTDGTSDSTTCFTTNEFRTRFKTMGIRGRGSFFASQENFDICTSFCGKYGVGMAEAGIAAPLLTAIPNPCGDQVTLRGAGGFQQIALYDLQGRLVLRIEDPCNEQTLRLEDLAPGWYHLYAFGPAGTSHLKVIRQ